jgi:uncharacterized protein with FMN-binding domain
MAMAVGADLWHMGNPVLNLEFYDENSKTSTFAFGGTRRGIVVGSDGSRFISSASRHGKSNFNGTWLPTVYPDYLYVVMDDASFKQGPIFTTWSPDNSDELAKGWIVKADTISELAALINVPADAMQASIDAYNAAATSPMTPQVKTGPFYALRVHGAMGNTQGGPVRNEKGEILDTFGNPIPHLYEAGELGDIWSNCYQAGNNLGGGFVFGRIIGKNASAVKSDVTQDSVMGSKANFAPTPKTPFEDTVTLGPNEYLGSGEGKGGTPIYVKVTMDGDKISKVQVMAASETPIYSDRAIALLPGDIVAANSVDVDGYTGATLTSNGIKAAVRDAMSKVNN